MPSAGRVGDKAQCPADAHGCPGCAHGVIGPGVAGSPDVQINGKPALRVGDPGIHAACCGPNTWKAAAGSSTVFINGKPAHRLGDMTQHCGGVGKLIEGSPNVTIGDASGGKPPQVHFTPVQDPEATHWIEYKLADEKGMPLKNVRCRVTIPGRGTVVTLTDENGILKVERLRKPGECEIEILGEVPE